MDKPVWMSVVDMEQWKSCEHARAPLLTKTHEQTERGIADSCSKENVQYVDRFWAAVIEQKTWSAKRTYSDLR